MNREYHQRRRRVLVMMMMMMLWWSCRLRVTVLRWTRRRWLPTVRPRWIWSAVLWCWTGCLLPRDCRKDWMLLMHRGIRARSLLRPSSLGGTWRLRHRHRKPLPWVGVAMVALVVSGSVLGLAAPLAERASASCSIASPSCRFNSIDGRISVRD